MIDQPVETMASDPNNSIMRTVSFVERIEVEFHGNVQTQAMVLADVDNDMAYELIVGNIDGHVAIFKGESSQAWKKMTVCGMLTCLAVGEIHLPKKNSLVCMTAEGWCYVYDISSHISAQSVSGGEDEGEIGVIKPILTQELPANAKVMCLADIDSDGRIEMVIGYSDRVVRAFRWHEIPDSDTGHFLLIQKWQLAGQIGSITINYDKERQPVLMVSQPGASFVSLQVKPMFRHIKSESYLDKMIGSKQAHSLERSGSFAAPGKNDAPTSFSQSASRQASAEVFKSKSDTVSYQSDNVSNKSTENVSIKSFDSSLNRSSDSKSHKFESSKDLDSQMSKGYKSDQSPDKGHDTGLRSFCRSSQDKAEGAPAAKFSDSPQPDAQENVLDKSHGRLSHVLDGSLEETSIMYHPLAHRQTRNRDTSTVIVGGINRGKHPNASLGQSNSLSDAETPSQATYYALATLDGSLILVENDSILWSLQVDHYLFALAKLDVTGNGNEEVVCCSWNGQTYIVNHSKEIVRYHFPDSVAAFCAGYFSLKDRSNVPCFVYATFNNRIFIYPNIALPRVESTNLLKVMSRKRDTQNLLQELNIQADDVDSLRRLYHWCLYGQPSKT